MAWNFHPRLQTVAQGARCSIRWRNRTVRKWARRRRRRSRLPAAVPFSYIPVLREGIRAPISPKRPKGTGGKRVPSGHHGVAVSDPQVKSETSWQTAVQPAMIERSDLSARPCILRMASLFLIFFCLVGCRTCGCGQGLSARPCTLRSRLRIRRSAREGNRTRSTGKSSAATAHRMTGTDTGHTRGSATDNPVSSFVRPLARSACLPSGDRRKF